MYNLMKTKMLFSVALLVLLFAGLAHAASPDYDFTNVEVNDLLFYDGTTVLQQDLNVLQEESLNIKFTLKSASNITGDFVDPVTCCATLEGYEFGQLSSSSGPFSVEEDKLYQKILSLKIPSDIDTSDSYTLRLECSDKINQEEITFDLFLNEIRHNVRIFDVLLNPSNKIGAGKPLFVTVRLENRGEKQEDDIKVTASIPELGISAATYLNELVTLQQEEDEDFLFEEEAQGQVELLLRLPEDAASGTYKMHVAVDYNRGHSQVTEDLPVMVAGLPVATPAVDTVLNIDSTNKQVEAGQTAEYRLMLANLGSEKALYSVHVDGVTWGTAMVDPGFVTVLGESTGQVSIKVTPAATTQPGDYISVARVMLGNEVVQEITLSTKVLSSTDHSAGPALDFKTILGILFAILVVILIVLGLIIAFRKEDEEESAPRQERRDDAPAPTVAEGQTYYYYPKR